MCLIAPMISSFRVGLRWVVGMVDVEYEGEDGKSVVLRGITSIIDVALLLVLVLVEGRSVVVVVVVVVDCIGL